MTRKAKLLPLALPHSRIRSFVVNPECAKEFFEPKHNSKSNEKIRARAEAFKINNLVEERTMMKEECPKSKGLKTNRKNRYML